MKDPVPVQAALHAAGLDGARIVWRDEQHFDASGQAWAAVSVPALGDVPLWMRLPATAQGWCGPAGEAVRVLVQPPEPEVLAEGRAFAESLLAQGQVLGAPAVAPAGPRRGPRAPSHELFTDAQGRRCLRRRGFD